MEGSFIFGARLGSLILLAIRSQNLRAFAGTLIACAAAWH